MNACRLLDGLMLRAPFYSFARYAPERLGQVLADPDFRRALLLASPSFCEQLEKKGYAYEKLSDKERFTLLKYYNRMCFRPTPFGAFASFSTLNWAEGRTEVGEHGSALYLLNDREWKATNSPLPAVSDADLIGLSPMVYRFGREFRFWRRQPVTAGEKYSFTLDAMAADPFTGKLVKRLSRTPEPAATLAAWAQALSGCTTADAREHIDFLVREQFLCNLVHADPLIGEKSHHLLLTEEEPVRNARYYAALERPASGGPSKADRVALETGLAALRLLSLSGGRAEAHLERFRSAFFLRFGDQKVPLLTALDPDAGVAYDFPTDAPPVGWTPVHQLFLRIWLSNSARTPFQEIHLDDTALATLATPEKELEKYPPTTSVLFRKAAGQLLIEHAGGATATALAGRFSLFSDEVLKLCRQAAAIETSSNPGVIFADVDCASGLHVDNINLRREIYDHTIKLDCPPSGNHQQYLLPADLCLSVRHGELILESQSLRTRIIPRLSTAFNQRHSGLGLFRLLSDLQYQGVNAGWNIDLESLFPGLMFYPRVCYGQCILFLARWKITKADRPADGSGVADLRRRLHIPAYVSVGKGDQQLVFDLNEAADTAFFVQYISDTDQLTVYEYLPGDRSVSAGHRPLAGQFLGLIAADQQVYTPIDVPPLRKKVFTERTFLPGSEWLYIKLYCAEASSSRVLLEIIAPFLTRNRQFVGQWFFIRYTDPEPHLRLRLLTDSTNTGILLSRLATQAGTGGRRPLIRAFRVETYERELERYGESLIAPVEDVFCAGSEVILAALRTGLPEEHAAFLAVTAMLRSFLGDVQQEASFAERSAKAFKAEFKIGKKDRIALDLAYREAKAEFTKVLSTRRLRGITRFVNAVENLNTLSCSLTKDERLKLLSDICHMQMNRSFATDQRRMEMQTWHFLEKYLSGKAAMQKRINKA